MQHKRKETAYLTIRSNKLTFSREFPRRVKLTLDDM